MFNYRLLGFSSSTIIGKKNALFIGGIRQMESLVSTSWLAEKLKKKDVDGIKIVHASWENCKDYDERHIPGSVCFDGEYCRDRESPYKNMLPKPEEFGRYVGEKLGIDNQTDVVIYDSNESLPLLFYAVRVWYMFRVFGHDRVSLLNGGLQKWMDEKLDVTLEKTKVTPKQFKANFRRDLLLTYEDVVDRVVKQNAIQLLDARGPATYKGVSTDGKSGHIPNSLNVPHTSLIDPTTKLIKDQNQLSKIFKENGVDFDRPIGTSCGAGMTATGVAFAAFLMGKKDVPVYDGSWYEWAKRAPDEYIVKG